MGWIPLAVPMPAEWISHAIYCIKSRVLEPPCTTGQQLKPRSCNPKCLEVVCIYPIMRSLCSWVNGVAIWTSEHLLINNNIEMKMKIFTKRKEMSIKISNIRQFPQHEINIHYDKNKKSLQYNQSKKELKMCNTKLHIS